MDPISLRFLERILAVAVGGLCIYLGYRLFINLPENTDSQGKFVLPGNISIYLSRVGPGVFFALFGAAIVALALYKGVTYQTESAPAVSQEGGRPVVVADSGHRTSFSGLISGQQVNPVEDRDIRRSRLRLQIHILNRLPSMLKADLDPGIRSNIINALPALKLSLLKTVWGPDWGDPAAFERWVDKGGRGSPPTGLEAAARMFRYGSDAGS